MWMYIQIGLVKRLVQDMCWVSLVIHRLAYTQENGCPRLGRNKAYERTKLTRVLSQFLGFSRLEKVLEFGIITTGYAHLERKGSKVVVNLMGQASLDRLAN